MLAILRVEGHHSRTIGAIQLVPTVVLVFAVALLLELATADPGPAAGDNGTGVGVAVELARALDAAPPRHLSAELVLQGAGDAGGIGLRRYLRARRKELTPAATVVLGVAACGGGLPRWWTSDGPLVQLRYNASSSGCAASSRPMTPISARPRTPAVAPRRHYKRGCCAARRSRSAASTSAAWPRARISAPIRAGRSSRRRWTRQFSSG